MQDETLQKWLCISKWLDRRGSKIVKSYHNQMIFREPRKSTTLKMRDTLFLKMIKEAPIVHSTKFAENTLAKAFLKFSNLSPFP